MPLAPLPARRHPVLVVLCALLAVLLLSAGARAVEAQDAAARGGAGGADDDTLVTAAAATAPLAAPVRAVVTPATATLPGLTQAQLREQRSAQLQTIFQTALQTHTGVQVTDETDPRIGRLDCELLGRSWTGEGCSRVACTTGHEYAKTGANAETCRIGGRRGASYGVEVDSRRCQALGRVWIGLLNYCASDPHRDRTSVPDAPQCEAPRTTYVLLDETDGGYDECLTPARAHALEALADASGKTLATVVAERSPTQCAWRPGHAYRDGLCVAGAAGAPPVRDTVAVIGDSITWRGTNELAVLQPDWVIDGSSGRQVDALDERVEAFRATWGEPGGVVFALGANGRSGWTEEQFRAGLDRLPPTTPVLLVTPYRQDGTTGRPALMTEYAGWMQRAAADRPATCLADWRTAVTDGRLLVDGVHPTTLGEVYWAEMVDSAWRSCLARNGLTAG